MLQPPRVYHEANSYQRSQYHLHHPSIGPDRSDYQCSVHFGNVQFSPNDDIILHLFMIILFVTGMRIARIFKECLLYLQNYIQENYIVANIQSKYVYISVSIDCTYLSFSLFLLHNIH